MSNPDDHSIYEGLLALLENEFPKVCPRCRRHYPTLESFVDETHPVEKGTGLMGYDTGHPAQQVVMARNCSCGSTMATFCCDRRDHSDVGTRRRAMFDNLLAALKARGIDAITARGELLAFLRGNRSEILESLGIFARTGHPQPQA